MTIEASIISRRLVSFEVINSLERGKYSTLRRNILVKKSSRFNSSLDGGKLTISIALVLENKLDKSRVAGKWHGAERASTLK